MVAHIVNGKNTDVLDTLFFSLNKTLMDRKIKYNLITFFLILIEFRFETSFQQLHIFLMLVIASFPS